MIGGTSITGDYWTSTEYSSEYMWYQGFSQYSNLNYSSKNGESKIRAFLAIDLQTQIIDILNRLETLENK